MTRDRPEGRRIGNMRFLFALGFLPLLLTTCHFKLEGTFSTSTCTFTRS
jgi:hypothetical protein